jgi:hypothetical protein
MIKKLCLLFLMTDTHCPLRLRHAGGGGGTAPPLRISLVGGCHSHFPDGHWVATILGPVLTHSPDQPLTMDSSSDAIRQKMLSSALNWKTIWMDGVVYDTMDSNGNPQDGLPAGLDRPDHRPLPLLERAGERWRGYHLQSLGWGFHPGYESQHRRHPDVRHAPGPLRAVRIAACRRYRLAQPALGTDR